MEHLSQRCFSLKICRYHIIIMIVIHANSLVVICSTSISQQYHCSFYLEVVVQLAVIVYGAW